MFPTRFATRFALTVACTLLVWTTWSVGPASADPILAGFDLFETIQPTSGDVPIFGTITFRGVPFPVSNGLGTTDTIVQRLGSLPSGTGPIPIEMVALHLVSVMPVLTPSGPADVHALINKGGIITGLPPTSSALPLSTGVLTVTGHSDPTGGTFTSVLTPIVEIRFTAPGGSVDSPLLPPMFFTEGQILALLPIPWTHTPPPGYPVSPLFPAGNFYVEGPFMEVGPMAIHTIIPPTAVVPEPSSLLLVGIGTLGLLGYTWRRGRRTAPEMVGAGVGEKRGVQDRLL
jgi:hypothetical protein